MKTIIFDVYNTLFHNGIASWLDTFSDICKRQGLKDTPEQLFQCWKGFEMRFRQGRTNLEEPNKTPPFRTYQTAWIEAFVQTFNALEIRGDPDDATQTVVQALADRPPFEDTLPLLQCVTPRWKTAVLSNADNASLFPLLDRHRLSFDAVLTSEMVAAYKPDQKAFQRILQEVKSPPE